MLMGEANAQQEVVEMQHELHSLFLKGGFLLHKWACSDPNVLESIPHELRDMQAMITLSDPDMYTETLGIERNPTNDQF